MQGEIQALGDRYSTRWETVGDWRGSCGHDHATEHEAWLCVRQDDQDVKDAMGSEWSTDREPMALAPEVWRAV